MTNIVELAHNLQHLFEYLNQELFDGTCPHAMLTIQSSRKAYGHCSIYPIWEGKNKLHEINIAPEYINRPIEETTATLVHEMVHLYNIANGVKDTSRGYTYHNRKFKTEAEKRELIIERHPTYGWTITKPTENLKQLAKQFKTFDIYRIGGNPQQPPKGTDTDGNNGTDPKTEKPRKPKQSMRKLTCPCGVIIRATKKVNVICEDCGRKFKEGE